MNFWLIKTEPETYSIDRLKKDQFTTWDGVRNYTARNNLRLMKKGDMLLIYHSGKEKSIVGTGIVRKEAFQDPTTSEEAWVCIDVIFDSKFKSPVTLREVKSNTLLDNMTFVRQSRLSVSPVTKEEFDTIVILGN